MVGHCVVTKNGEPVMSDHGPLTTFVILPAERWRIEETWQASGLTGSGSHHVVLEDAEISEASAFDPLHGASCVPGPFDAAVAPFVPIHHGAVAVGIAAGALPDLVSIARARPRPPFPPPPLPGSPGFSPRFRPT